MLEEQLMDDQLVILEIQQVVKSFGNVHAVNGVNLNIHEGAVSYTHLRAHET